MERRNVQSLYRLDAFLTSETKCWEVGKTPLNFHPSLETPGFLTCLPLARQG